jgi:hypothetical protein
MKKILNYLLIINGALLILVGVSLALLYFWLQVTGTATPGQSLILTNMPILVLGLVMCSGGGYLLSKGIKKLRGQ